MIVFDLVCRSGHRFEAWFRSAAAHDEQHKAGQIVCPECGDTHVEKALTAPNIARSRPVSADAAMAAAGEICDMAAGAPELPDPLRRELDQVLNRVRAHVEAHCDYVGDRFAEEARAMHYGETTPRGIYGEATTAEAADLMDEGIELTPLPTPPRRKADA
ncbi:hypothetical protein CCR85_07880 [Rhodothalassium salexigens]|uniref:DUF1178 family protein n=1 Tax=Rhodothalassium salexigens DSM 2132 TaxID=1188247 RepID=A0A4R2PIS3_RHOSA|nr:DUF1178 family protein [Rhodothalassium salexigens]MBB4211472.1 hypothetical protein [Rhodothalassium salexigens DSM 2132]MBK1640027.1 hypothetical protein [Rhodothalassium salexigens DSM 2132]MBK5911411.1 hypothetical protein [Rhodothalassium salexigens]MBK5920674.1 hypothetical protein [Rhodothalassium salexigens]TCP35392.1 hypothetical protein EV659_104244 [Rhodothalassium salexigens DSM 2132]